MKGFDPRTSFGEDVAAHYDAEETRGDERETVAFLAGLADGRPVLELAVGTGRIALPLARAAGVRVDGIEQSPAMVDRLRAKPDGDRIDVTMGDMSRVTTGRAYGLVYLVFNTIATSSARTTRSAASRTPPATWTATGRSSSTAASPPRRPVPATGSSTRRASTPRASAWTSAGTTP